MEEARQRGGGGRKRGRAQERAREDPRINLASELTRKDTCPIETRPFCGFCGGALRGPTIAPTIALRCRVAAGMLRARDGKCHRTRKQLLRRPARGPRGPLAAGCPPLKAQSPSSPPSSRVSNKSDLPQSIVRRGGEGDGRGTGTGDRGPEEREKEAEKERKGKKKRKDGGRARRATGRRTLGPQLLRIGARDVRGTNCADFYEARELPRTPPDRLDDSRARSLHTCVVLQNLL